MVDMRIHAQWLDVSHEMSPELSNTWSDLVIEADGIPLTEAVNRASKEIRNSVRVSAYPLAEWIAYNWFLLTTPFSFDRATLSNLDSARYNLAKGVAGYPYPSITFRADRENLNLSVFPRGGKNRRVSLLASQEFGVPLASARADLWDFVESVVDRLEATGVTDTALQIEWSRVTSLSDSESEFCEASAALGLDPFDLSSDSQKAILRIAQSGLDESLLWELLPAVDLSSASLGVEWVVAAEQQLGVTQAKNSGGGGFSRIREIMSGSAGGGVSRNPRPWHTGYERARRLRALLDLDARSWFATSDLVHEEPIDLEAPRRLDGLMATSDAGVFCLTPTERPISHQRFVAARALSRGLFEKEEEAAHIIWHGQESSFKAERAFAAELLAPAEGVAEILGGDFGPLRRREAAEHFQVGHMLIEHQINNQIRVAA